MLLIYCLLVVFNSRMNLRLVGCLSECRQTSNFAFFLFATIWTWPFWKVADCCHIASRYILTHVLLYQLNSWSLPYQLPSLYPRNSTVVVFSRRLIVDLVGTQILHNRSYNEKKGIEVTRGSLYSPLFVPDFLMPFPRESRFLRLTQRYRQKNGEKRMVPGLGNDNHAGDAGNGSNGAKGTGVDNGARGRGSNSSAGGTGTDDSARGTGVQALTTVLDIQPPTVPEIRMHQRCWRYQVPATSTNGSDRCFGTAGDGCAGNGSRR